MLIAFRQEPKPAEAMASVYKNVHKSEISEKCGAREPISQEENG